MFTSSCGASSNICSATSSFRDASTSSWRCLQKLSTEPKSFQKRSLDVKRVSAQFAVANADAHATASRSGPILSHAADNEASNACIVDGCQKVVIPFRPTTIRDDADGIEVFQAHVAEICHGRNLRSSLAGEIPQRLDPVSPMEIVWAEACHHLPWRP